MMDFIQTISIPSIVVVVYGVMFVLKSALNSERFNAFIPLIAALVGGVFGVLLYVGFPDLIPATNFCSAIIIGAASGWAATGMHQTGKQLKGGNQ